VSAVSERARELHAQHHPGDGHVTCAGCRMAASWLIVGRERGVPRARRAGEAVDRIVAAELLIGSEYVGRIIQTPGHRGYFRNAQRADSGVYVCTASGVSTYPPDTPFLVWGP